MEHTYDLADTDFDPLTAPQVMAEYLNKQMAELLNKADLTLTKYEVQIKEAERTMSKKDPLPHYHQPHQPQQWKAIHPPSSNHCYVQTIP